MFPARTSAYLKLFAVVIIWGLAPPIIKYTLHYFSVEIFLSYRFFISSLIMVPLLFFCEKHWLHQLTNLPPSSWPVLIINSLIGSVVQLGLLFWGLQYTSAIEGAIINAMSPIFVAIASYLYLHEHITRHEKIGLAIAFIGSIILVIDPGQKLTYSFTGNAMIFLGTLAWAIHTVISKEHLRLHLSPLFLTTSMFFTGFISMSIITIFFKSPSSIIYHLSSASLSAHAGVLFMALLSGSLAYYLYQSAAKFLPVTKANLWLYLPPVFTLPVSLFILRENLDFSFIVGCIIIIIGVILSEIKTTRRF